MKIWIITGAIANHDSWAEMLSSGKSLLQKYDIEVELFRRFELTYTVGDENNKKIFANGVETTPPERFFNRENALQTCQTSACHTADRNAIGDCRGRRSPGAFFQ